jgi:hypothetical protein
MIGVIALIGDGGASVQSLDKVLRKGDVVALPRRADQADWQPQRIASGMDLGAQPTSRPAQTLGIRPPFSLRAPAAC